MTALLLQAADGLTLFSYGALLALAAGVVWFAVRTAPGRRIHIASSSANAKASPSTGASMPTSFATADPERLKAEGNELLDAGRYAEALAAYDSAALLCGSDSKLAADLAYNRSVALAELGRYAGALAAIEEERRINVAAGRPEEAESMLQRGSLLARLGPLSEAVDLLRSCMPLLSQDEERVYALDTVGYALYQLDQTDAALECFEQAQALRQTCGIGPEWGAIWNRAVALHAHERDAEAVAAFAEAEAERLRVSAAQDWQFEWDRGKALASLAELAFQAAEEAEALATEAAVDAVEPPEEIWQGFDYLNYSHAALEAFDSAIRLCRDADVPVEPDLLEQRAWILYKLENWREALEAYIEVDQLTLKQQGEADPQLALSCAKCYSELKNYDEALVACGVAEQRFLAVGEPVDPYLYWLRAYCFWAKDEARDAHAAALRAIELYAAEGEVPVELLDFAQELAAAIPTAEPEVPTRQRASPSGSA